MIEGMTKHPTGFGALLCAAEFWLSSHKEIAIMGSKEEAKDLLSELSKHNLPYTVVALAASETDITVKALPFMQQRPKLNGKATVYVCENSACKLPVNSLADFKELLNAS